MDRFTNITDEDIAFLVQEKSKGGVRVEWDWRLRELKMGRGHEGNGEVQNCPFDSQKFLLPCHVSIKACALKIGAGWLWRVEHFIIYSKQLAKVI